MQQKLIFALLLVLPLVCVAQAQSGPIQLYDNFNHAWLNPAKWATIPTCSATQFFDTAASIDLLDCIRAIQGNKLRLMVKAYGHSDSDTDRQFGPSELYFANPNAVTTMRVTFRIAHSTAVACPSNGTNSFGQVLIAGSFFNPGTGDPNDDVIVDYFIERQATAPQGTVHGGAVVWSKNAFYGYVDFGIRSLNEVLTATIRWDRPNHLFIFRLAGDNGIDAGQVRYSISDDMLPVAPMKLMAARAFVPNCTTQLTSADMDVYFDDVYTNQ